MTDSMPGPGGRRVLTALPWSVRLCAGWAGCVTVIAVGLYVVVRVATALAPLTLALAATAFCAALLQPLYRGLRTLRFPAALASLVSVVVLFAAIVAPMLLTWRAASGQFSDLPEQLGAGLGRLRDLVVDNTALSREQLDDLAAVALDRARDALPGAVSSARLATEVLGGVVLVMVLLFFVLKDSATLWGWIVRGAPSSRRTVLNACGQEGWQALTRYVRAVMIVAAVDAIGIGAALFGLRLALPLTILTFVGAFIPIVGATVSGLLAVLVALAGNGPRTALLILAAVIVVQQLEGNVLHPIITRRQVRLHPAVILVAVTAGGLSAGIAGAFLAVPLVAVAYRMIVVAREHRRSQATLDEPVDRDSSSAAERAPHPSNRHRPDEQAVVPSGDRGPAPT